MVPKPEDEARYPAGVVAKALKNVAYQDDGLIQYKAEVMLRIFEKDVMPLIGGGQSDDRGPVRAWRACGILKSSRQSSRSGAPTTARCMRSQTLPTPKTNAAISEHAVNGLADGELIEDRFEGDDYRFI